MNTCLPCNKHYFYVILDSSIALPHSLSLSRTHKRKFSQASLLWAWRSMYETYFVHAIMCMCVSSSSVCAREGEFAHNSAFVCVCVCVCACICMSYRLVSLARASLRRRRGVGSNLWKARAQESAGGRARRRKRQQCVRQVLCRSTCTRVETAM